VHRATAGGGFLRLVLSGGAPLDAEGRRRAALTAIAETVAADLRNLVDGRRLLRNPHTDDLSAQALLRLLVPDAVPATRERLAARQRHLLKELAAAGGPILDELALCLVAEAALDGVTPLDPADLLDFLPRLPQRPRQLA
jgi:hypothetical protein